MNHIFQLSSLPAQGPDYWIDRTIHAIAASEREPDYLRMAQRSARTGIAQTLAATRARRILVDMPTQAGKTPIYIDLLQRLGATGPMPRVLLVAPYRRLVNQVRDEFVKFGDGYPADHPLADIGVWHGEEKRLAPITATTWQSKSILVQSRIVNPREYDIVILDEAHLSQTDLRRELLGQFSNALIWAYTATPAYSLTKTLEKDFTLAFRMTPAEAVEQHVISPWRSVFLLNGTLDMSGVPLTAGDYDKRLVEKMVSNELRTRTLIEFYNDWVDPVTGKPLLGRKGFVNTVTVTRAEALAHRFNAEIGRIDGALAAEAIHSDLSPDQQKKIFDRFKHGETRLLVQIRLAGLGLSRPEADLCLNDTPSLSPVEVAQRAGRAIAINPADPDKCAIIGEFADEGGRKASLLYGEVVGPGVGYDNGGAPRNDGVPQSTRIIAEPEAVKEFLENRAQTRKAAVMYANFTTAYPELMVRFVATGHTTLQQLWNEVYRTHKRLYPGVTPRESHFVNMLKGDANPWNSMQSMQCYQPMAIAIATALHSHANHIFGSSESIMKNFSRTGSFSDPQREHILKLMREAHNPLTGKKGLTNADLRQLGTCPQFAAPTHTHLFDSTPKKTGNYNVFDSNGAPEPWAQELADILDQPVEHVFRYTAKRFSERPQRDAAKGDILDWLAIPRQHSLPLHEAAPLRAAAHIIDPNPGPEDYLNDRQLATTIDRALLVATTPRRERIARLRLGLDGERERTLEDVGGVFGLTKDRIRQIVERVYRDLRGYDQHDAWSQLNLQMWKWRQETTTERVAEAKEQLGQVESAINHRLLNGRPVSEDLRVEHSHLMMQLNAYRQGPTQRPTSANTYYRRLREFMWNDFT